MLLLFDRVKLSVRVCLCSMIFASLATSKALTKFSEDHWGSRGYEMGSSGHQVWSKRAELGAGCPFSLWKAARLATKVGAGNGRSVLPIRSLQSLGSRPLQGRHSRRLKIPWWWSTVCFFCFRTTLIYPSLLLTPVISLAIVWFLVSSNWAASKSSRACSSFACCSRALPLISKAYIFILCIGSKPYGLEFTISDDGLYGLEILYGSYWEIEGSSRHCIISVEHLTAYSYYYS